MQKSYYCITEGLKLSFKHFLLLKMYCCFRMYLGILGIMEMRILRHMWWWLVTFNLNLQQFYNQQQYFLLTTFQIAWLVNMIVINDSHMGNREKNNYKYSCKRRGKSNQSSFVCFILSSTSCHTHCPFNFIYFIK